MAAGSLRLVGVMLQILVSVIFSSLFSHIFKKISVPLCVFIFSDLCERAVKCAEIKQCPQGVKTSASFIYLLFILFPWWMFWFSDNLGYF